MLSINQKKHIRSLQQKKQRDLHGLFLLEGNKLITDLLSSGELNSKNLVLLCATEEWRMSHSDMIRPYSDLVVETNEDELKKVSSLVTPPPVLAVVRKPALEFKADVLKEDMCVFLESIRDPGNLGTILRTADWFGIRSVICSPDSVDCFNPKVVQASMGAVMRVDTHYMEASELMEHAARYKIPVYGTTMDGNDLYETPVRQPSVLVFGNESTGISEDLQKYFRDTLLIPSYPADRSTSESLNVGISLALLLGEVRRRSR